MKPELKENWIKALRSGKYIQTSNYLRVNDGYCCLGVLCDVLDPKRWGEKDDYGVTHYSSCRSELNFDLLTDVKLPGKIQTKLIDMNDIFRKNFNEIADWIEENL